MRSWGWPAAKRGKKKMVTCEVKTSLVASRDDLGDIDLIVKAALKRRTPCQAICCDIGSGCGVPESRMARMSRIGGWPKKRLYSRLNWVGLS